MEGVRAVTTTAGTVQTAVQGVNALAATANQVSQVAQQANLGAVASAHLSMDLMAPGDRIIQLIKSFESSNLPDAQKVDEFAKGLVQLTEQELIDEMVIKLRAPSALTADELTKLLQHFVEECVNDGVTQIKDYSPEIQQLFWQSMKKHIYDAIIRFSADNTNNANIVFLRDRDKLDRLIEASIRQHAYTLKHLKVSKEVQTFTLYK